MTRLIDADALIEAMTKFSNATGEDMTHGIFYANIAPTIDAEPVRHGKWILGKCNRCGEHAPFWSMATTYYESNYCPNCGARMDEE